MKPPFRLRLVAAAMTSAFALPIVLPSYAQNDSSRMANQSSSQAEQTRFDMRASQLIGKEVWNRQEQSLGEIQDVFVDVQAKGVPYAVLSFDEGLGFDDKLFAFPMTAFKLSRDRGEMVLNVPQERLRNAPGFSRDTWPNNGDGRYFDEVNRFFGDAGKRPDPATQAMMRGTELIGRNVNDRNGGDAGEVQDFVVDIGRGRVSYIVLEFDKAWSLDDKLLPLPLTAFTFPKEHGADLVLKLDRDRISTASGFESNTWPDLNAPAFRQRTDAYFLALERPMSEQAGSTGQKGSSGSSR